MPVARARCPSVVRDIWEIQLTRSVLCIAVVCLALHSSHGIRADTDLSEGSVREMLADYVSERATAEKREEITNSFRTSARRSVLRTFVARAAVTDGERPHALQLAIDLQLDGLFKKIKKEVDGPDEALVVKYLFTTQDSGAMDFLYDRWEQKAIDSNSYKAIADGFVEYLVEFGTVERLYKYTRNKGADSAKVLTAADIVRWQIGSAEGNLEQAWKEFSRNSQINSKAFPMRVDAVDVVPVDEFHRTGLVRRVGKNYQLLPGAAMEWNRIPDGWQNEVFFLKLRVRVMSGDGASVVIETEGQSLGVEVSGGKWTVKGGNRTADVDPQAWEEIVIFCQYDPRVEGQARNGVVTVENKLTIRAGQFNGKLTRIRINAGEGSTMVIGNMHMQKQRGTKDPNKRR
jgi:hypothetical protein